MKDQVFTGRSVTEAVEIAGRTLGLAPDAIRYVILERESPGVMGVGGTPARIAVLLENSRGQSGGGPRPAGPVGRPERPKDPRAAIRAFVRELAETAELDLTAEVEDEEQRTIVRLFGDDLDVLLEDGGEVLIALDHLMQRAFGREIQPRRLVVECEGFKDVRESALRARALDLVRAVKQDGKPRETEPLNGYERRLVHMAVAEESGVRTFSVGEGQDRRVTIAIAEPGSVAVEEKAEGKES
jgi:spoIIIJ-associated protein